MAQEDARHEIGCPLIRRTVKSHVVQKESVPDQRFQVRE